MSLPQRAEVVVVGAGLAGLSAATRLASAGRDVHVLEAARRVVRVGGAVHRVVDPRRRPTALPGALTAPLGAPWHKAAIAAFSARAAYTPVGWLLRSPERSADEGLRRAGVGPLAAERFFRPFLAGVLLEAELATSSRYPDLLWRSFARGAIGLPAAGMQAVAEQLAARLDPETVHPGVRVDAVSGGRRHGRDRAHRGRRRRRGHRPGDRRRAAARHRVGGPARGHHAPARAARLALAVAAAGPRAARRAPPHHRRPDRRATPLLPRRPGADRRLDAGPDERGRRPRGDRPCPRRRTRRPRAPDDHHRDRRAAGRAAAAAGAPPGRPRRRRVRLRRPPRHPALQGAMASGARCARAVLRVLRPNGT